MKEGKQTVLIFPPLAFNRRMLECVSFLFGTPSLCLPWHMDVPVENVEEPTLSSYSILRPLQEMKPPEDFPGLLREYRAWMKDHSDRSALSFFSALKRINDPEDARWEIQKMVREGSRNDAPEQNEGDALKWHLTLHLAAQLEGEQREAEKALRESKAQGSPLKEALGEETGVPDIMEDLSPSLPESMVEQGRWRDVCVAWLGLFGKAIKRDTLPVTFDVGMQRFLAALFEEAGSRMNSIQVLSRVCFDIGDPLFYSAGETISAKKASLKHQTMSVIEEMETQLQENGEKTQGEIDGLVSSLQEMFPVITGSDSIHVEMVYLPEITRLHPSRHQDILKCFSGKILAFLAENAKNG